MHITKTIIVNRPPEEVYSFWQDHENFLKFMHHLEAVGKTGEKLLHWQTKPIAGQSAEWDMEIDMEVPHLRIAWRTVKGSSSEISGSVRFDRAPGGRGTLIIMEVEYEGGTVSTAVSKMFGEDPGQHLGHALRLAKQVLETGAISVSEGSIIPGHPAQPPSDEELGNHPSVRGQGSDYTYAAEQP